MLKGNLKTQRKAKGLTQEELAIRLNVVRQTVSKWEKGQSVPDADLLIQMADIFEVSVSELLGTEMENNKEIGDVAQQLSRINEKLAIMNRRARRIWKTIAIVAGAIVILSMFLILLIYFAPPVEESTPPVWIEHPEWKESPVNSESVTITYDGHKIIDITIRVGESFLLDVSIEPDIEGDIEWISSDQSVFNVVPTPEKTRATLTALSPSAYTTLTVSVGDETTQCVIRVLER